MLLASCLAVALLAGPPSMAAEYTVGPLIAPAPLHGANGMELEADGRLVVAKVGAKRLVADGVPTVLKITALR